MYVSHELGRIGENIIADYITKLGYKVVERNFACNQGEIDIIAKDKEELVFIEVKLEQIFLTEKQVRLLQILKKDI